nr:protein kinase [Gammaproteobacteria bacterium]
MQSRRWSKLQELFDGASKLPTDTAQAEYLRRVCAGDAALEREVSALLAADKVATSRWRARSPRETVNTSTFTTRSLGARRIGPYRIRSRLGSGRFGVVYEAFDEQLLRDVAVKVIAPRLGQDQRLRRDFLSAVRALSGVEHVNVFALYGFGETPSGELYIAMPRYQGESLEQRLQRGPIAAKPVGVIGRQ